MIANKRLFVLTLFSLLFAAIVLAGERRNDDDDVIDDNDEEQVFTASDIPARIAKAEVGEWVLYRLPGGSRSRLTVVEKWSEHGDTYLVIQNEVHKPKKKRPFVSEERISVKETIETMRALEEEDRIGTSKVLVHGRAIKAVVVSQIENGKITRQSYFSEKIPVYGIVRGVTISGQKKEIMSIMDYGFAEDYEDEDYD